jgi:hypothetical protein
MQFPTLVAEVYRDLPNNERLVSIVDHDHLPYSYTVIPLISPTDPIGRRQVAGCAEKRQCRKEPLRDAVIASVY